MRLMYNLMMPYSIPSLAPLH